MDILKIIGVAVLSAVISIIVKKTNPEIAIQISIAAGIIIFIFSLTYFTDIINYLNDLSDNFPDAGNSIITIIKITGICYICEFIVQLLRDSGENLIASKVEVSGKVIILVMSFPVITSFIEMITVTLA